MLDLVCLYAFPHNFSGRTGVIIACYLVFNNRISAGEAIQYVRFRRLEVLKHFISIDQGLYKPRIKLDAYINLKIIWILIEYISDHSKLVIRFFIWEN